MCYVYDWVVVLLCLYGGTKSVTQRFRLSPPSSSYWISTNFFLLASLGWLSLTSCPVSWKEPPLLVPVCTYRLLSLSLMLLLKNSFVLETPPCPLALLLVGWGDKEKRFRRPSNRNNLPLTLMVKICLFSFSSTAIVPDYFPRLEMNNKRNKVYSSFGLSSVGNNTHWRDWA